MTELSAEARAVLAGQHADPFAYLGMHLENGQPVVRAFLPGASSVAVVDAQGRECELPRLHEAGLFAGVVPSSDRHYRVRALYGDHRAEFEDAYRFPPILSDYDL